MAVSTIYTHFHFKANRLRDLQNITKDKPIRVEVVKVVELTEKQFRHFSTHMLDDMPFIIENRNLMREVDGVYHCLLVCVKNHRGGILVESEGYNYARYAADVLDKSALDLRDVPVDHYDLKLRQPRLGPER